MHRNYIKALKIKQEIKDHLDLIAKCKSHYKVIFAPQQKWWPAVQPRQQWFYDIKWDEMDDHNILYIEKWRLQKVSNTVLWWGTRWYVETWVHNGMGYYTWLGPEMDVVVITKNDEVHVV